MSDLPVKQTFMSRLLGVFKGIGKVEEKPLTIKHGASWQNPYGVRPQMSPELALSAYGGHGYTFAAVSRSAQDLAALPIKLLRGQGKNTEIIDDHEVLDLFAQPSTYIDGYLFREQIVTDLILSGNAYAILLGDGDIPVSVMRLHPQEVEIVTDPKLGIVSYRHESSGVAVLYPPERVIHIRNASYNVGPKGLYGTGVIEPLTREINADINAQKLASMASAKGRPDVLIYPKDVADIWGRERRREILDQYSGMAREGGAMVLSGQVEVEPLQLTPRDMEYKESRVMARESISAAVGCPPSVLGLPSANYATARQQAIHYWQVQKKRSKKLTHMLTVIAQKFDPLLRVELSFDEIDELQDSRDAALKRIEIHIRNGMDPGEAYNFEGLGSAPIVRGDSEDLGEDSRSGANDMRSLALLVSKTIEPDPPKLEEVIEDEIKKKLIWEEWIEKGWSPAQKKILLATEEYLRGAAKRYAARARQQIREVRSIKFVQGSPMITSKAVNDWAALFDRETEEAFAQLTIGDTWNFIWKLTGTKELKRVYKLARQQMPLDLEFGGRQIAAEMIGQSITEITRTTERKIRKKITRGLIEGLSVPEIGSLISNDVAFDVGRAKLIARTEATRSVNGATVTAYQQAADEGIKIQKQWLAARGNWDTVRDLHKDLDGQTTDPHLPFVLETGSAAFAAEGPGQFGEASMDCNCRCVVLPIVED